MATIRLADYCCQAGDRVIDQRSFSPADLVLRSVGARNLIFAPLGSAPTSPKLALVGITPGGQSEDFAEYLETMPVEEAAKRAAFRGAQNAIKELLRAHGFAKALDIDVSGDLNSSEDIFTTSLVKCCLRINGSYKWSAKDIDKEPLARACLSQRFLPDMQRLSSLTHVVVFGDPGWELIRTVSHNGRTILEHLIDRGLTVLKFPHFAQNFQQRVIFAAEGIALPNLLKAKPEYGPYVSAAAEMRTAVVQAVKRLRVSA
jgi:hypothetical protein